MTGTPPPAPLVIRQLRKSYGEVVAVDGLDLEIRPGECFGLLGPNAVIDALRATMLRSAARARASSSRSWP